MLDSIAILINGLTLALAFGLLLIVLWYDARKPLHQYFAVFLFMVLLWNAGALLTQAALLIELDEPFVRFAVTAMELGFSGASVGVLILTTVLVRAHVRGLRTLAFLSLLVVLIYRLLVSTVGGAGFQEQGTPIALAYQAQPMLIAFYLLFDGATLYMIWRQRRKIRSQEIVTGISAFVIGQSIAFLNPALQAFALSTIVSSIAALVTSFAILKLEILTPLTERMTQVEAIHRVSLAITSQIALDTVLEQIAVQAARWLRAEAVGIWLLRDGALTLTTVHNLPERFVQRRLQPGQGVVGTVAQTRQSVHLEDYRRDWRGLPDLPVARETFGSVIAAPLTYGQDVMGALMVIAARDGRLFDRDDVHLLELLGAQAAVAIANSHLFEEQKALAQQVEASRSQLETVLSSTQNPVIALNRSFELIFINPAGQRLVREQDLDLKRLRANGQNLLRERRSAVLRKLRSAGYYTFEIALGETVYLCYITALRTGELDGWVAILNDITQLKELDRMKNEMVRMTSHDLKNPLQAALLNLDLLRDDLADSRDPEVKQSLDVIEHQLGRMHRIIRGILDLEKARSGVLKIETCEPARLVQGTVDELRHFIDMQKVRFEVQVEPDLPLIQGDADQLKQALVNLVENAFKFTPAGGCVRLTAAASDDGGTLFTVEDSGVGIPAEAHGLLFNRFFRVNQSGTEHVTGSGLGLSLVKTIVENHGGTISFKSEVGKGTTFYVLLPRSAAQPARVTQEHPRQSA